MKKILLLFFLAYLAHSYNPCIQCNGKKFTNCKNVELDCPPSWEKGLEVDSSEFNELFLQCMEGYCLCGYVPMYF